ncbi:hypothetical protein PHMEG_00028255 [Phytophthora megakarya]|uniref:Tf2-1-like SH3-like domain-containing protein n=1 Tax=Phytophthora megakarya TaxID=4795 RepID=A0A225V6D9_9STRA|nr:hypothetical protein PHMEG_00028255 [Phytophthora megakarya]
MSEVFQAFAEELIQARSRSTLSYRPQANGQQERSVITVMQSVKVYVEDPLQQNWDEIAERLVFAINNSHAMARKETPFYLVHGWDWMLIQLCKRGTGKQSEASAWRREINRQQQVSLEMAKEYQATEKARRAREHNEKLSRKEQAACPEENTDNTGDDNPTTQSLFQPGNRWVKPGLVKKLAHRWHGPFRIKRKVEEFAYELELPDKSGYRFYPVVHVSRLKAVNEFWDRPQTRLAQDINEDTGLDFDEELLPEAS